MTNLVNAKPRFALNPDGTLFDYLTGKTHAAVGTLHDHDGGIWDLAEVAHAIKNDKHVESAHYNNGERRIPPDTSRAAARKLTEHDTRPLVDLRKQQAEREAEVVEEPPTDPVADASKTAPVLTQGGLLKDPVTGLYIDPVTHIPLDPQPTGDGNVATDDGKA